MGTLADGQDDGPQRTPVVLELQQLRRQLAGLRLCSRQVQRLGDFGCLAPHVRIGGGKAIRLVEQRAAVAQHVVDFTAALLEPLHVLSALFQLVLDEPLLAFGLGERIARAGRRGEQARALIRLLILVTLQLVCQALEDGRREARPQVRIDVVPGVEPQLNDVPAVSRLTF